MTRTADSDKKRQEERGQMKDWRDAEITLSNSWRDEVQDHYEYLIDYTRRLEKCDAEPATQFPLAEKFRLGGLPEEDIKKVEKARR